MRSLVWTVVVGVVLLGSAIVEHRSSDLPQPVAELGVEAPLTADDVADVIAYALNAPGHVNLDLITMRPVAQSAQHLLARGPLRVRGGE